MRVKIQTQKITIQHEQLELPMYGKRQTTDLEKIRAAVVKNDWLF